MNFNGMQTDRQMAFQLYMMLYNTVISVCSIRVTEQNIVNGPTVSLNSNTAPVCTLVRYTLVSDVLCRAGVADKKVWMEFWMHTMIVQL